MAKKEFKKMTLKEQRSALGGSKSAYVRRKKKYDEHWIMKLNAQQLAKKMGL